jgi:hypothetical protein
VATEGLVGVRCRHIRVDLNLQAFKNEFLFFFIWSDFKKKIRNSDKLKPELIGIPIYSILNRKSDKLEPEFRFNRKFDRWNRISRTGNKVSAMNSRHNFAHTYTERIIGASGLDSSSLFDGVHHTWRRQTPVPACPGPDRGGGVAFPVVRRPAPVKVPWTPAAGNKRDPGPVAAPLQGEVPEDEEQPLVGVRDANSPAFSLGVKS